MVSIARRDAIVLGVAALVACAMPALLLADWGGQSAPTRDAEPPPLAAPIQPPLAAAYQRPLFALPDPQEAALPGDAPPLVGIVGRLGADAVALVRTAEGRTRTLAIGESVDGWRLESLAIDAAFFTRGSDRVRVPLPAGE